MSYIHSIAIGPDQYLIEPVLYAEATASNGNYTTQIDNYSIITNTILFLTVPATNDAATTLTINNGTPVPLYYQGVAINTGALEANSTYILTYYGNKWNILNDLTSNATITIDENGGLEDGASGVRIKTNGITNSMIADGTIANIKLANSSITIAGNTVSLGGSVSLADLGLSAVLHFKGIANNNSLEDGSLKDPLSLDTPIPNYNGNPGDVILDIDKKYEYVWVNSNDGWELLGSDEAYKIVQTAVADPTANGATDAFIDSITQNTNGDITVTKKYVLGWQYPRKVYTDLTTASMTTTINGGASNATAIGIGVNGILPLDNGGTGADETEWSRGGIVYGKQVDNNKYYSSIAGSQYQILTSGGTDAPVWATAALLESVVNNTANAINYTTLELGNDKDIADIADGHSEGRLVIYSAGTEAHLLRGANTSIGYEHFLPNANGYLVQATSANAVGSSTQPVYIGANGVATALTFEPNRLYYSASASSFTYTNHYASASQIALGATAMPINSLDTLYISGSTTIGGVYNLVAHLDVTTVTNTDSLLFRPDIGGTGQLGNATYAWYSANLSNTLTIGDNSSGIVEDYSGYINIINGNSNIELTTINGNNECGKFTISTAIPTIILETTTQQSDSISREETWTITNTAGTLLISNDDDTSITGTDDGWQLLSYVGIGAAPSATYILYVEGNSSFKGHILPQADDTYDIGSSDYRWKNLYLSTQLSVGSGATMTSNGILTLSAATSKLILQTTTSGQEDWVFQNASGVFTLNNSIHTFSGNNYGFKFSSYLYINENVPSSNAYNLYVNGTTYHTGDIIFAPTGNTGTTPKITWSGSGDIAEIYYTVNTAEQGNLVINTEDDTNCLIALAYNDTIGAYFSTSLPSFYPATTATGSLGIGAGGVEAAARRWGSVFIGTADTYGDAYTPIYWNAGVPAAITTIQYIAFTIASGKTGVQLTHAAFTTDSYVLQIVVTNGESNLNSPIDWNSDTAGSIKLTCTTTSGAVSGYILVARGKPLTVTSADITESNT